ncbi:hypothetical protein GTP55_10415 [Duganella sp. FT109W]|uniref:Uncharacterized protein n=1 Tax=Duganella margarita TaxID=2692170 RepID=A0ABW9WFX5_9BURK|nr:hypothetical protein [Duganella margarita]MYN39786.1 hypothetical protein [Duganella margarita]
MTISYQTYVPNEADIPNGEQSSSGINYVSGGVAITFNKDSATATSTTATSVSTSELSVFEDGDWRQTARTPSGSPTNLIEGKTIVRLNGVEAPIDSFVRSGILLKSGDNYTLPNAPQPEQQVQEQYNPDAATMPPEIEQAANDALAPFEQGTYDAAIANSVALAVGDMDMSEMTAGIVRRSGMDPADVEQRAQFVVSAFQAQADSYLSKQGLDASDLPAFYEWCRSSRNKAALKEAVQRQVYHHDMAAYKPLVTKYMNDNAPDAATLRANGFDVRSTAKGDVVFVSGVWMAVEAAAKAGMI